MASFNGFLRKSPPARLAAYFKSRNIDAPDNFNWDSAGRGNAFIKSVEDLIDAQADLKQDATKAELDHLSSLSKNHGMTSAEQICAGQGIDIEGFEGVEDVLLMLAIENSDIVDRIAAQASLMQRYGGNQWSAFQFDDDGQDWALDDENARQGFLAEAVEILDIPAHRKREADWYKIVKTHPITGEAIELLQATIYVEARAESELSFGASETLERQIVQKVVEVGLSCNIKERLIEICAKGGKKARDRYADAFAKHFVPSSKTPVETPRRDVILDRLRKDPVFQIEPADGIERVEVSKLDFRATGGGISRHEWPGQDETIYQFLKRSYGSQSPTESPHWQLLAATVRIVKNATETERKKTLTVTLRAPNSTTLPNRTEADREFVFALLERWHLLAPPNGDQDVVEND